MPKFKLNNGKESIEFEEDAKISTFCGLCDREIPLGDFADFVGENDNVYGTIHFCCEKHTEEFKRKYENGEFESNLTTIEREAMSHGK